MINSTFTTTYTFSPLQYIVILDGGDRTVKFQNPLILTSTVKDPNILSGTSKDFLYSWICSYPDSTICKDESGQYLIYDS